MTSDFTRNLCENCSVFPYIVCEHHQIIEELEKISEYLYEIVELINR